MRSLSPTHASCGPIYTNDRKCDQSDARMIARLARVDPALLCPIQHTSEQTQRDLLQVKLRDNLVRPARGHHIVDSIHGEKPRGEDPLANPDCFAKSCRKALSCGDVGLLAMCEPSIQVVEALTKSIPRARAPDRRALREELSRHRTASPNHRCGADHLTYLRAYPSRIPTVSNRPGDVAPYLGLVPKRDQSGNLDREMRISKAGDAYLAETVLVSAGPIHPRAVRAGLRSQTATASISRRVAVAPQKRRSRGLPPPGKLAVLLLTLWKTGARLRPRCTKDTLAHKPGTDMNTMKQFR